MRRRSWYRQLALAVAAFLLGATATAFVGRALAALPPLPPAGSTPAPNPPGTHAPAASGLLTIFLRHDQSRPLGELNEQLFKNGFYDRFPPDGIEVVSWYVMMGIGQVVTLRVPPERLREVNVALEQSAWGAYRTEFYPTYDYRQLAEEQRQKMRARRR